MSTDPHTALTELLEAFEHHFEVARVASPDSAALVEADNRLSDAFFTYDDILFTTLGVELPFDILDEEDENEVDDELDYEDLNDDEDDDVLDIEA